MKTKHVLLLNYDYSPVSIITWQRAVSMWVTDKVEIVEEYHDDEIRSVNFAMKCPAVVRLVSYVRSKMIRKIKFSRTRLYARDDYECQYCLAKPGIKHLTMDHVVPRFHGGKTTWENIVTACRSCNYKKANKILENSGLKLKKIPRKPSVAEYVSYRFSGPVVNDLWSDYLY